MTKEEIRAKAIIEFDKKQLAYKWFKSLSDENKLILIRNYNSNWNESFLLSDDIYTICKYYKSNGIKSNLNNNKVKRFKEVINKQIKIIN